MTFDRAFNVAATALAAYPVVDRRLAAPFGHQDAPAHRWRVGVTTWRDLRDEAKRTNGMTVPSSARGITLLGWPLVVDENVDPATMALEPVP